MLRNPINFIFKLGKYQSLPFRPLRQLSAKPENPPLLLPTSLLTLDVPERIEQSPHSNQMSS